MRPFAERAPILPRMPRGLNRQPLEGCQGILCCRPWSASCRLDRPDAPSERPPNGRIGRSEYNSRGNAQGGGQVAHPAVVPEIQAAFGEQGRQVGEEQICCAGYGQRRVEPSGNLFARLRVGRPLDQESRSAQASDQFRERRRGPAFPSPAASWMDCHRPHPCPQPRVQPTAGLGSEVRREPQLRRGEVPDLQRLAGDWACKVDRRVCIPNGDGRPHEDRPPGVTRGVPDEVGRWILGIQDDGVRRRKDAGRVLRCGSSEERGEPRRVESRGLDWKRDEGAQRLSPLGPDQGQSNTRQFRPKDL